MQQFLVLVLALLAAFYLIRHVYNLFFSRQSSCEGCGLAPKRIPDSKLE
jgi:hypothetical protein